MATDRCWECDRGLRDGVCPSCGWERPTTAPPAPKPPVHRPGPPRSAPPASGLRRDPDPWPDRTEVLVGRQGLAAAREILAAHQPPPESPVRAHLRAVARGLGRPKAVAVAGEVLEQLPDPEETHP